MPKHRPKLASHQYLAHIQFARRLSRRAVVVAVAGRMVPAKACFSSIPPKVNLDGYYQEAAL